MSGDYSLAFNLERHVPAVLPKKCSALGAPITETWDLDLCLLLLELSGWSQQ